jgi:multidrug efflux pump subunit AcrB
MESVLRFALRHPITVMVATLAIVLGFVFSLNSIRMDVFPDLNQPVIYVAQPYGGMDPAQMEGLITNYYEYAFLYMSNIDHVESKNIQNLALIKLYFHSGTDMANAMAEAAIFANRAKAFFPPGTVTPFIFRLDASSVPVAFLTMSSETRSISELSDLMLFRIRPVLASLPGSSSPQPFGGSMRTIIVNADPERLRAYSLSPQDVVNALNLGNVIAPSGNARIKDIMPIVSVNSVVVDPKDMGNIPIKKGANVYLRDVGTVEDSMDIPLGRALVDGRRAVYMPILKTGDASTLTVANELKDNLDRMRSLLPKDVKLTMEFDQSPSVTGAISGVVQQSVMGAILTGLMVLLFLRDWRSMIVVILTIPLALFGAVVGLFATGNTINLMTLGGMSLAVGILEGTVIVVIENIHTQFGRTKSIVEAVMVGTAETMVPILLMMFCILAVFVPAFLMEGAARGLFVPLAMSVGAALIVAYLLAVTFVPVMSIWVVKHHGAAPSAAPGRFSFASIKASYSAMVSSTVGRWRWVVLPVYLVVALAVLALAGSRVGWEIAPVVDAGQFQMRLRAPSGTRLEVSEDLTREALQVIKDVCGADKIKISVAYVGVTAPTYTANAIFLWTSGTDSTMMRVALNPGSGLRVLDVQRKLRDELPKRISPWLEQRLRMEGLSADRAAERSRQFRVAFEPADVVNQVMCFGAPAPLEVVVSGPDMTANTDFAGKVLAQMKKIDSLKDLQISQVLDYPRIMVEIDRERAGFAGLTVAEASNSLIAATSSSRYVVPVYWVDPKSGIGYQVQIQIPPERMNSVDEVGMIPVKQTPSGQQVLLRDIARISWRTMAEEVDRLNQLRFVSLTANIDGEDLGHASNKVQDAIKAAGDPPRGVRVEVRGQVPPMNQMFEGLATGLVLAVIAVFLMLTAYFQSPRLALVSIASTPAVAAGVATALWLTDTTLNIESFMGSIMAIGVAVANAILLIAFAERTRRTGKPAVEAAVQGAEERLRPILMASCATIAGMVPMALGMGEGGEQTAALGRAVIGGLLGATVTTLFILPSVFSLVMGSASSASPSLDPTDPESPLYLPIDVHNPNRHQPPLEGAGAV